MRKQENGSIDQSESGVVRVASRPLLKEIAVALVRSAVSGYDAKYVVEKVATVDQSTESAFRLSPREINALVPTLYEPLSTYREDEDVLMTIERAFGDLLRTAAGPGSAPCDNVVRPLTPRAGEFVATTELAKDRVLVCSVHRNGDSVDCRMQIVAQVQSTLCGS